MQDEALSDLIARIYDCALDPEGWADTVGRIARAVGAPFGVVALHDIAANRSIRTFAAGIPAPVMWLYGRRYAHVFRLLAPHVVRSMRFADLLGMRAIEVERLTAALDVLSAAVWLVDASAQVLHANAAAGALLRRPAAPPLRVAQGRLVAAGPQQAALLAAAIAEAAAEEGAGFGVPQRPTIPLGDAREGEGLIATVLRLGRGAPQGAVAAVFVQHPFAAPAAPVEAFGALHGLTPAEIRCLGEIALGRTVPEAAAALGIGPATARSHMHAIFTKTGASRQPELIRMLAAFAPPLRAPDAD